MPMDTGTMRLPVFPFFLKLVPRIPVVVINALNSEHLFSWCTASVLKSAYAGYQYGSAVKTYYYSCLTKSAQWPTSIENRQCIFIDIFLAGYDYTPTNPRLSAWFLILWRGDYDRMLKYLESIQV
jgi:hypothetical protein